MPKTKFGALDIRRLATELDASCVGTWVQNIYDVDSKTFLLKLTEPGRDKMLVVIESGVRFHSTKFVKEKADMPSGFSMKLRKHIRQKRLLSIEQLGGDRVVDFKFGLYEKHESEYHIILELYAAGNVVLTDCDYNVLSLIRVFKDDEVRFAVGENYLQAIGKSQGAALTDAEALDSLTHDVLRGFLKNVLDDFEASLAQGNGGDTSAGNKGKSKKTVAPTLKQGLTLRTSPVNHLGPDLVEHCILLAGLRPGQKLTPHLFENEDGEDFLGKLLDSFKTNALDVLNKLDDLESSKAVLIFEKGKTLEDAEEDNSPTTVFYDRFEPVLLEQYRDRDVQYFDSLNDAVDEFYSKIDIQRQEKASLAHKKAAAKKVEAIRKDQESRIQTLHEEVSKKELCAEAITFNVEDVDKALLVVRSAVASGMSWDELDELISLEKSKGNPIASLIESTALERNEITLRLPMPDLDESEDESDSEDDSEEDDDADELEKANKNRRSAKKQRRPKRNPFVKVNVNINLSAYANVSSMYQNKKQAVDKAERTKEASEKVLEAAEKKYHKEMEKHEAGRRRVREQRKVNWFEKFLWFITSEGILVLAGRDAQQNELLVKKYLRASHGDIYVHADLHGAATCIVRAPKAGVSIPPESLRQAGAMTVCMSNAWTAKIITSAWWVHADQVSKTAPTGEYLTTGSFMIRGKKNFLPPCRLELSFGFIFKLDETQESYDTRKVDWRAMDVQDVSSKPAKDDALPPKAPSSKEDGEEDGEEEEEEEDEDGFDVDAENQDDVSAENSNDTEDASNKEDDSDEGEEEETAKTIKKKKDEEEEADTYDDQDIMDELEAPATKSTLMQGPGEEDDDVDGKSSTRGGGYMTAKERRQKKKEKKTGVQQDSSKEATNAQSGNKGKSKAVAEPKAPKGANTNLPRRKKNKLKKMKKKYGDQTEEDRRLAMIALGHKLPELGNTSDNEEDSGDEASANGANNRSSGPGTSRRDTAERAAKKPAVEDDSNDFNTDELNLKSFTMNPQPDDVLLYALPMCAPPQATTKFKYRVKLVPGALKKGKAGKMATEVLLRIPNAKDTEKEHMRYVTDNELVQTMAGNVKLMAPGLAAATSAAKKKSGGKPKKQRVSRPKGGKVKNK
mmetsp:Transcript_8825/g.17457  ORF Transcript_8825/g.17457 Transcript_8825/m.17457 type:complete len:1132 (-) Transcript_8825:100-3495(-)